MISLKLKTIERFFIDNSPLILTVVGVGGTVTTAVLAGQASFKAAKILEDLHKDIPKEDQSIEEDLKAVWQFYIPTVVFGALTVSAIVFSNRISTRRATALAAAYSLSERAYAEYREKVIERVGKAKEEQVRHDVAQAQVDKNPVTNVIFTKVEGTLCLDSITGRYFKSNIDVLKRKQNEINSNILRNGYASLYDFYKEIGIPPTEFSGEIGWTDIFEIYFSATITEDNEPCIVLNYSALPIRNLY
jgi:hypothetical protein